VEVNINKLPSFMLAMDFTDFSRYIQKSVSIREVCGKNFKMRTRQIDCGRFFCAKFSGCVMKKDIDIFYDPRA
jgi:hypothetical protein